MTRQCRSSARWDFLPSTIPKRSCRRRRGGQLENELGREDWIIEEAQNDDAFTDSPENLWSEVLRRKGGIYELVARIPDDPSVN